MRKHCNPAHDEIVVCPACAGRGTGLSPGKMKTLQASHGRREEEGMVNFKVNMNDKGATLIEFIAVLPVLLIFLFGIIDFGLLLYNKAVITNACREGARFGIVARDTRYTEAEIRSEVIKRKENLINFATTADPGVLTDWTDINSNGIIDFGDDLEVNVTWTYTFLAIPNMPGIGLSDTFLISANTVMKYE